MPPNIFNLNVKKTLSVHLDTALNEAIFSAVVYYSLPLSPGS